MSSVDVPRVQLEAALQHARAHPRWKNYVDQDLPPPPPSKGAESGGLLVGGVAGGFTAWHLLQKGYVLRSPRYLYPGWDFKPEGWALRPKPRLNPTVFVYGMIAIGALVGRSFFGGVKRRRQKEWQRLGLVPKPSADAAGH